MQETKARFTAEENPYINPGPKVEERETRDSSAAGADEMAAVVGSSVDTLQPSNVSQPSRVDKLLGIGKLPFALFIDPNVSNNPHPPLNNLRERAHAKGKLLKLKNITDSNQRPQMRQVNDKLVLDIRRRSTSSVSGVWTPPGLEGPQRRPLLSHGSRRSSTSSSSSTTTYGPASTIDPRISISSTIHPASSAHSHPHDMYHSVDPVPIMPSNRTSSLQPASPVNDRNNDRQSFMDILSPAVPQFTLPELHHHRTHSQPPSRTSSLARLISPESIVALLQAFTAVMCSPPHTEYSKWNLARSSPNPPSDVEPVAGKDWQLESTIMLPILRQFLARFSFSPSLRTTELCKLSPSTVGLAVGKSIRKLYGSLGGRSPHDGQDETCGRHFSPGSHSIRFRDCDRPLTQSALTFHDHAYASSVVFVSYYHDTEDTSSKLFSLCLGHQYLMAIPLHNISVAYEELTRSVDLALRTQIGDAARLGEQKRLCLEFQAGVRLHAHLLPAHDLQTVQSSVGRMVAALDEATTTSSDFPDAPPVAYSSMVVDGTQGHPRIDIKPEDLARFSTGRATRQQIADIYGCSARTIRRRLVEFGLSSPGPPVYTDVQHTNGSIERIFSSGVSSDLSQISDAELDQVMLNIYKQFPSFGRRMIDGYLLRIGERVPRQRILDSYLRVIGPTTSTFATRRIQRRVYSVPGPNSHWHHDGQHGLIHWKIVIHAFIDGFSRFSLGIRASNNNRAETVLCLFEDIAAVFGYPSRTRGDHGTENLLVASRMEEVRGEGRGSYIWGNANLLPGVYTTSELSVSG
ncbi:hypothetical protein D9615_010348 [Tricholomella constricta]|uniref:Integrase catalytic domain-containing protein n=1 Tax=Tricholomella constricta TaxID=117010 RepID=A0A8H5GTA5_9AGAR|nr:hypothetical protein D9615_010348 [Tricholomella constricta]